MNQKLAIISIFFVIFCVQVVNADPPTTSTDPAASIFAAKAILNGTLNPNGLSTTYYFEYGETDSYGNATEGDSVNNVSIDIEVNAEIINLSASTIYHCRLVATNADGTSYGDDSTFATKPAYTIEAIPSPYSSPTGITYDGEFFWVVADWPSWIYKRIYQLDTDGIEISSFQTESGPSTTGGEPEGLHFDGTYLWLADPRNDRFIQYDTAGNEIATINSPAPYPTGLTFDGTFFWNADLNTDRIYQLDTFGNIVASFYSPGTSPKGLEFDGTYLWNADSDTDRIYKLDTSGNVLETMFSPGTFPSGLAFDGTFLWCSDYLDGQIYKLDTTLIPTSTPPLITTDSADSITEVAARFKGTLNPNGLNTTYYFEYGVDTSYGTNTTLTNISAGINNVAANRTLTNLLPDTTYHFRLVAENSAATVLGVDRSFTTLDTLDPPELSVTPADGFQTSGFLGGPFTPNSQTYTLENIGQVALDWTASNSKHWVDLSGLSGTLNPGETTSVDVSINESANSLVLDTYTDSVLFLNTTNSSGNTGRSVVLEIGKTPSTISCNISTNNMTIGSSLNVSGLIDPSPTDAGAWVDIVLTSPLLDETHIPVQANALGQFFETLACQEIDQAGAWLVQTTWNGDDQYSGATSSPRPLSASKATSNLTLDIVTSDAIKINSIPPIGGKFSIIPSCEGFGLQATVITLRIIEPDVEEYLLATTVNQNGQFLLDYDTSGFAFDELGEWTIQALFAGNDSFNSSSSEVITVRVVPTAGYALLIQGKSFSGEGLASHIKTTNFVYEKLIERQLAGNDISYFGWDGDNPAVDAQPFKSAIQTAITETMRDKMIANPGDLYIVMVNHGWTSAADNTVGEFYLSPDSPLTSTDLSIWLDTLQNALRDTAAENQKIIVILGFCRAGAFIDDISANNRVVIASAAADEYSHRGPQDVDEDGQPLRDGEYFMSEFFKSISYGKSVKQCFEDATMLTEAFTSSGSGETNAPYYDDSIQHPILDDNYDGIGSNELSNIEGEDGFVSEYLFIGASPAEGNDPGDVLITQVNPAQFMSISGTAVDLWAEVDSPSDLRLIWVEIKEPNYNPEDPGVGLQLEMNNFKKATTDVTGARYAWTSVGDSPDPGDLFDIPGTYQVFYFAKDNDTGHVSPLIQSHIYKALDGNTPPSAFSLLTPADQASVLTTTILDWEDAIDPDGDNLTYTVLLSKDDNQFTDPIRIEGLTHSAYLVGPEDGILDLTTYYWKVEAIDAYGAIHESNTRVFHTDDTNPAFGWIMGYVTNTLNDEPVAYATVEFDILTLSTDAGGYYIGVRPPGIYDLSITAAGFDTYGPVEVRITEGGTLEKNIEMTFSTADTEPIATITSPAIQPSILVGGSVDFQGSITGGNLPFSYLWDFNGGATNSTLEDPGDVIFSDAGTYDVTFTVTDDDGDTDSDTVTVIVTLTDSCPGDPDKTDPGVCGCGVPDTDTDNDTTPDCNDPDDDNDGILDGDDDFPLDDTETVDTDEDGTGDNADTDDDNDGISDTIEGVGPNAGDANNDGIQDSLQSNVASFGTYTAQGYVVLESPPGTVLSNCQAADNPSPGDAPADMNFDYGFFDFTISGLTPGGGSTLTITLPSGAAPTTYYKYGRTPANQSDHWYEFLYENGTGAEINGNIITLNFVDALRGDDVLAQDSKVIDLGAPGFDVPVDDGDGGGDGGGGGGGCFIDTLRYF